MELFSESVIRLPRSMVLRGRRMLRRIIIAMLLTILIMSMFVVVFRFCVIEAEPGTRIYLSPSNNLFATINTTVGTRFNVTVRTDSVLDLSAFQVKIYFNDSLLNVTRWFEPTWDSEYVFYGKTTQPLPTPPAVIYQHIGLNSGSALVSSMLLPLPPSQSPFSGSGKLCMLEFNITVIPKTEDAFISPLGINNTNTYLLNSQGLEITAIKEDGRCEIFFTGPIVFVAYPLDGSLISGNEIEIRAAEMNLATNVVNTTFEYTQNEAGPWHTIGVDNNATDGWSITWNLTGLIEGSVSVRARMINTFGEVGEDISRVIFDLVLPNPMVTAPTFPTFVSGMTNLTATTFDPNAVLTKFWIWDTPYVDCTWYVKNVSKLDQHEVGVPKPNDDTACGPTAAASCLAYWDNATINGTRPYDDLYDDKKKDINNNGYPDGLEEMAKDIWGGAVKEPNGMVRADRLADAINRYIQARPGVAGKLKATPYRPSESTMETALKEFLRCQDVIMLFNISDGQGGYYGHYVTLSSVHFVHLERWEAGQEPILTLIDIDFMDPWDNVTRVGEVYLAPDNKVKADWNGDGKVGADEFAKLIGMVTVCPQDPGWSLIGVDNNGTDGWRVQWDTTKLPDAFYLVEAAMTDATGNNGMDLALVYVNNARVTGITPARTVVGEGYHTDVQVSVENLFVESASFNVTLFCNETLIATQNVTLTSKNSTTLRFVWDTTGVPKGNYIISVNTSALLNGTTLARLKYTDGQADVVIPGDVNANGKVDIIDLLIVAKAFGTSSQSPNWNPNIDIDCNNKVNIIELLITAKNYGKRYP
jgi:hypothetical protein